MHRPEFVGTSITSDDVDYAAVSRDLPHNSHVPHFESRHCGYLFCEVTPQLWRRICALWTMSEMRTPADAT